MLKVCAKIVLPLLLWSSISTTEAVIRPGSSLSILSGEGFIAYLEVPKGFGEIKNCWFKFRDYEKVRIELNASEPIKTERNEYILPYTEHLCGIRVSDVSASSAAIWTLETESVHGDTEQDSITIKILPPQKTNFDTRVQLEIGKSTVKCSKHESYTRHCKIVDIYNGGTHHQCELYTSIHPNSMFECFMYNWGRMEESRERIFVDIKNSTLYTNATQEDQNSAEILGCEFQDKVFSCQAEMPNHKNELLIMDGVYNGRYSAYNTVTSKSRCYLEIPKPFKEGDIGLWRIINYESSTPTGCLFYIGKNKQDIILSELSKLDDIKRVNVYEPEATEGKIDEMSCSLPFIIYDCYLKSPNNTIYFPDGIRFERQRFYGKCAFYNLPIIAGIWTCGSRGRDYDKEVIQNIEVVVKSKFGETLTEQLKAKRGDTVELMCKSPFDEPISHCAFIDPQGGVHLVGTTNSIKSKGHVKYYGRGINQGECGIKITEINRDDFGQWKCQFIIYSGRLQSSFVMELKESESAYATSVGLGVGLTVIIVLILGVVIGTIFYRRRNLSSRHNFASGDPLELQARSVTPS
ncbi:uncharacterized protein LOC135957050 isoform X1 [Calliphora vicina]|uniref:uncharacterized protein LOC135957050 isoform X1 n=1 Tax=Calliphora vicina TaxID=7373 RepID=UPI00325A9CE1